MDVSLLEKNTNKILNKIVFSLSFLITLLGIVISVSWFARIHILIQPLPGFPVIHFKTVLGLTFSGLGLLGLFIWRPLTFICAAFILIISALSLVDYFFNIDLLQERFFLTDIENISTDFSRNTLLGSAVCFIFTATALFLYLKRQPGQVILFTIFILGLILLFQSSSNLILDSFHIGMNDLLPFFAQLTIQSGIGFFLIGLTFILNVLKDSVQKKFFFSLLGGYFLTIIIGAFLFSAEVRALRIRLQSESDNLTKIFTKYIQLQTEAYKRLVVRIETVLSSDRTWNKELEKIYFVDFPELESTIWISPDKKLKEYVPRNSNQDTPQFNIHSLPSNLFEVKTKTTAIIPSANNSYLYLVGFPIFNEGVFDGVFLFVMNIETLFETIFQEKLNEFNIAASSGKRSIYASGVEKRPSKSTFLSEVNNVVVGNRAWNLTFWPQKKWFDLFRNFHINTTLLLLFGISILVAFLGKAIRKKQQLENQFSLILNSSGEGICCLDLNGQATFANPAAIKLLGWKSDELREKNFFSLVLPEDEQLPDLMSGNSSVKKKDVFQKKDGSRFYVQYSTRPIEKKNKILGSVITFSNIDERKQLELALVKGTEDLTFANKELEVFSYSVSHDLRAPLRQVIGFINFINKDSENVFTEKSKKYFSYIVSSATHMQQLVDGLLAHSRIGRSKLSKSTIPLNELVNEIVVLLKEEVGDRKIKWDIRPLPVVFTDQNLLYIVFLNLISNALKFTRKKEIANIHISSEEKEDEWIIKVQDNGVGFNIQYQDKLFRIFQRLHSEDEFEGTGIGLANVKRSLHSLEGKIWVESEEGVGTSFYFTIPKEKEDRNEPKI